MTLDGHSGHNDISRFGIIDKIYKICYINEVISVANRRNLDASNGGINHLKYNRINVLMTVDFR